MVRENGAEGIGFLGWSSTLWLFLIGVAILYATTIAHVAGEWATNDSYSHGFFIFPISAALVWMRRDQIRAAERRPEAWGLALLAFGVGLGMICFLLQVKYIGMYSLVPTLAGGILALHGRQLWRIVQFPIWFLLFAAPLPNVVLGHLTGTIQGFSTLGASEGMSLLGCPVLRHGNVIQVPGATLEVATACSGFHKLISLLAFSAIYGYLFLDTTAKRAALLLLAIPIALIVNILRISGLMTAAMVGGLPLLHQTHDPAEIVAIFIAFGLFVLVGRKLSGEKGT